MARVLLVCLHNAGRSQMSEALWLYLIGPLVGAALGALVYQLVRGESPGRAAA